MRVTLFITAVSLVLSKLVLGGNVYFYAEDKCDGEVQYQEKRLPCGACVNSPDESGAALIGRLSSRFRVTVHNESDCTDESVVLEVMSIIEHW
ncbi:hypothetical protein FRC09_019921 [Ceratobasidium sp. 395]|nr:hypothetical protein FRC09_019921 [Ceratobasidium sp. 395]